MCMHRARLSSLKEVRQIPRITKQTGKNVPKHHENAPQRNIIYQEESMIFLMWLEPFPFSIV